MKQCILCNKDITKNPQDSWKIHNRRKFCNSYCYHSWQNKFRKIKHINSIEKNCKFCNKLFTTTFGRESVCSKECKLYRKRFIRNILSRKYHLENRKKAIEHYGGKCVCCGEDTYEFLCIDHINNDGHLERKAGKSTRNLYNIFRQGIFPKHYQLLCHNCNMAKGFYGKCPHQKICH